MGTDRYMNIIRKMSPGTLGGQSRVATPPARILYIRGGSVESEPPPDDCGTIYTASWTQVANVVLGPFSPPGSTLEIDEFDPNYDYIVGFEEDNFYLVKVHTSFNGPTVLSAWMGGGDNDYESYTTKTAIFDGRLVTLSLGFDTSDPISGTVSVEKLTTECQCEFWNMAVINIWSGYSDSIYSQASIRSDPRNLFPLSEYYSGAGGFAQIDVSNMAGGNYSLSWIPYTHTDSSLLPIEININGGGTSLYLTEETRNVPIQVPSISTTMSVRIGLGSAGLESALGSLLICSPPLDT